MFFTISNFLERMVGEPISLLSILSITAIVTTISLFFCGIPICLEIWRRKSTHEISGFPFLMGFIGGAFWLRYGMLKLDITMITVNCVGVFLMFIYILFYLHYTKPRGTLIVQLIMISSILSCMLILVEIYQLKALNPLGFVCMTFNIINFGAPLAGLRVVLKKRSCETLPLPLCIANFLVSSQWCLYGFLVRDIYIIIPNGAGMLLAIVQILLFLIFPIAPNSRAPLHYCCPCLEGLTRLKLDNQYQPASAIPNDNFTSINRMLTRGIIPPSRSACIAFLRSEAFNSGSYHGFDSSFSSRTTAISRVDTLNNSSNFVTENTALNNRQSSMSYPELFEASTNSRLPSGSGGVSGLPTGGFDSSLRSQSSMTAGTPVSALLLAHSTTTTNRNNAATSTVNDSEHIQQVISTDIGTDFDRHWIERDLSRTFSAPDLIWAVPHHV